MSEIKSTIILLIDYDNLSPQQKETGILDLAVGILFRIPFESNVRSADCHIRIYGGWFEEDRITNLAEQIIRKIGKDFPCVKYIDPHEGRIAIKFQAELALGLLQEPNRFLSHTYRSNKRLTNVRIEKPDQVGCFDPDCILKDLKKLIKKGRCPKKTCQITGNLIYRSEQKIVDALISCDLVYAADKLADLVILVSGDDDFVPPLRTAALNEKTVIRFNTTPNNRRDTSHYFNDLPNFIIEKDL